VLGSEAIPRVERGVAPAIAVTSVSKSFALPHLRTSTVRERLLHPFADREADDERLEALHDVSLTVERGEFFGIAGKNGSGKSTLLRCIAGIYPVDRGTIEVPGRLVPFIELGVGFNPELSARDNIVANAVMFGLNRKQAAARVDEILAFAELERFGYQKLKNYSTGMSVRLAFAVTMHVEADTLIFDEVLAVGDSAFKEKCFAHFDELRRKGQTIVLVTHDMQAIRKQCDRALLLHGGEVVDVGAPQVIAEQYDALNAGGKAMPRRIRAAEASPAPSVSTRPQRARLLGAEPRAFLPLVRLLALTEFRLKYLDSRLSYAWAVARPLGLFGVMYAVFSALGRFNNGVHNYPVYLFMSIVLWTFFAQATDGSVWSLVRRASFLRKIPFPLLAAPLSQVASALIDLLGNLVVVLLFALLLGVEPRLSWLEMIPLVGALALLAMGLACLLSAAFVRHRDLHQIWAVVLQALFFTTPLFYVSSALQPPWDRVMVLANPIAAIITQAHQALVDPSAPSAADEAGGAIWLLCPAGVVLLLCALGVWVFARESAHAAENV
jgi:ABC-type polysaccharide/polyol phosphate transport system ATPase subunit/ABC-type polysaccharide/polyol phosphate export permease